MHRNRAPDHQNRATEQKLLTSHEMKTILARSPHDSSSFSFSRRFNWRKKVLEDEDDDNDKEEILGPIQQERADELGITAMPDLSFSSGNQWKNKKKKKKPLPQMAVSKLRSALTSLSRGAGANLHSIDVRRAVVGTLFGYRRGHVHFAVQSDSRASPEFLIQLAAPTSVLVREMASGLVRIALECDKKVPKKAAGKLLEEPVWRAYCNGRKCGYGLRHECGPEEARVLRALEPVSMGAGVLPGDNGLEAEGLGELMYMRARFERVVGSRDSEAFYMVNPDRTGGPELSFYLMRV